jgi:hypothetical protein
MQTRYKNEAGSVCGFFKFVTSGFFTSKIQIRVQGSKIIKKIGFWVQVWLGFCKKHPNTSEISL